MKKIIKTSILLLPLMAMILFADIDPLDPSAGGTRECPEPDGHGTWIGPEVYEFELATNCIFRVVYCYRTFHPGETPEIFIHDHEISGSGCNLIEQPEGGPGIDWINEVYTQILSDKFPLYWNDIGPCGAGTHGSDYKYVVKNGGCYQSGYRIVESPDLPPSFVYSWESCGETIWQCYEFYRICRTFVNGQWVYHTEYGPAQPQFNCTSPCNYFCD